MAKNAARAAATIAGSRVAPYEGEAVQFLKGI